MRHNHDGFWNYKKLVESILDDVSDIQDYPYNLSTVIVMISDAYRALGRDFPEGKSHISVQNVDIYWTLSSRNEIFLEDMGRKGGIRLRKLRFDGELEDIPLYSYHNPSDALISTLRQSMQDVYEL
jgi:hypothetical protein